MHNSRGFLHISIDIKTDKENLPQTLIFNLYIF